ncbi:hypothetical protein LXA43DRAFT_907287 [Ganoderma leucocontextum]|nr:hypothetical protein LXA43DRAFT_907287 [Ganoderma leucocontextum]
MVPVHQKDPAPQPVRQQDLALQPETSITAVDRPLSPSLATGSAHQHCSEGPAFSAPAADDAAPASFHILIPEEDPTRPFELIEPDGQDEYISLVEDGIGYDDGNDDGAHDDAELDAGADESGPTQERLHKSRTRPLPGWLMMAFQARLAESRERGPDKLPALYRTGTFWFPQRSAYFLLRQEKPSPQVLFEPHFFLWDPLALHNVACPHCHTRLNRDGPIPYPRRVVDFDSSFWMIGYRYRCPACINPNTGHLGTSTFCSWDARIVDHLPRELRAEFPAQLTRRSGISQSAFHFMRSCFQNGMGAKQFADAVRVQHLRHYDILQLQYLHFLRTRQSISAWPAGQTFAAFLAFDDASTDGYRGFVPSASWFRDVYAAFQEAHAPDIDQHTAMLSGEVYAIDHSHKISKHVFKLDGVEIYCGTLTVTNEKGEIRVCDLVPTKAHSQFQLALQGMQHSLALYGHKQPALFYTDNMLDKPFLEKSFPSLREDVIAVEKHAHLQELTIPEDVIVFVRESISSMDLAIRAIYDQASEGGIVVGLDTEWNVDLLQGGGRDHTAVLQIATEKHIYIMRVSIEWICFVVYII